MIRFRSEIQNQIILGLVIWEIIIKSNLIFMFQETISVTLVIGAAR